MATDVRMEFVGFNQFAPGATAALRALSNAVDDSGLEKTLTELIKIRASQVNDCTFCLQFHLNAARMAKVPQTKLDLVAVWRDAGIFSAREMAALAWAEVLAHVTPAGVTDQGYRNAAQEFGESNWHCLTAAIARCLEQACDGLSVHSSDTTRRSARVELNVPADANFSL
jgi:AhpD family alkylhydroperoxidase